MRCLGCRGEAQIAEERSDEGGGLRFGRRRIKTFRMILGVHPDEFEMPGITLDVAAYREGWRELNQARAAKKSRSKSQS